ncbi:hypothetical protein [Xanthomonas vasicola]|uniref:hypothetical protein n=1 Tax=Xanthomonas vasicola TaxID=56459 RepID=UPI001461320D|nr:hypothetical protein [Xanthomonas vasicola]
MRNNQRNALVVPWKRSRILAGLAGILLAGCVAAAPKVHPLEGPVGLGKVAAVDGPKVRPDRIIEDSRCPPDVQCIVEGRLIVRATVFGGGWSKQVELTLGIPVPVADGMLTLVDATPVPINQTAAGSAARFTFKFQGGR